MSAGLIVIAGIMVVAMFRLAAAGKPLHRRLRRQGGCGRRRDGRRHQQHAAGARVLRPQLRARPLRRHRRSGTRRPRPQPALSREAAADSRGRDSRTDDRAAGVGHHALAAGRGDHRRRRAGLYARTFDPERDARPCGGAGRRDPACRPPDRSDRDLVAAARVEGSSRGRAADPAAAPPSPSTTSRSTIPAALRCSKSSACAFSPDSGSAWSASPAAENPACSRCCSGSTTSSTAASRSTARIFHG